MDLDELRRRLERCLGRKIDEMERLPGGASGLTFQVWTDLGRAVARVAPPGLAPVRNRDVLRQARVLAHLSRVEGIAVPLVLGADPGEPPEVPPLFVVDFVEGDSVEPLLDPVGVLPQSLVDARSLTAVRMLAALHEAPVPSPESTAPTTLVSEAERWIAAFASVEEHLEDNSRTVGKQLLAWVPDALPPVIVHGDWRLGNMLCSGAQVAAVIDWELWSVGDPRIDLAWFELFSDPHHPLRADCAVPLAEPSSLRSAYEAERHSELPAMGWFAALVRFKQAAAAALLVKNARRRPRPGFDPGPSIRSIPVLLANALNLLASLRR